VAARLIRDTSRKVVLGYPCGGSVTVPFHASVLRLLWHESAKSDRDRLLTRVFHASGLYVGDNRQLIVERFLKTDADWLLMVDTDIEFQPELLGQVLGFADKDRRVIAANVPLGTAYPTVAFRRTEDPGVWECLPAMPHDVDLVECDAVATAVFLCHREVFETIAAEHGQCWFHHMYLPASPVGTPPPDFKFRAIGEDIAFCIRAKRAGFSIYTARVPGLKHHKVTPYSEDYSHATEPALFDSGMGELVAEG